MGRFCLALLRVDLQIPASQSLKDRRQVVRSILEQGRRRWNVSVADLGPQGSWDQAQLVFAAIGSSLREVEERIQQIVAYLEKREDTADFEILDKKREVEAYDDLSN